MRFEILSQIGTGAFGVVYKAHDRETGEVVALKQLKPEIAAQADLVERFRRELLVTRKVTHRNVCRVYDLYRDDGGIFISMEYVEGERLRDRLDRTGRLPLHEALDVTRQILDGLEEAHSQGVVHRDLKPENVMIAVDGTVKVMDFGVARSLNPDATTVATGGLSGTPAYMSPEQALGQTADARSDIYSLGLMLYEMVCGTRAFEGDSALAVAMKQVSEAPPAPRSLVPELPEFVASAIMRCLSKPRSDRYASVSDLRRALTPGKERTAVAHTRARGRLALAAVLASIAAAFVMVAATAGLPRWSAPTVPSVGAETKAVPAESRQAPPRRSDLPAIAVLDFANLQGDARYAGFQRGIADALSGSLANTGRFRIVERSQLDEIMKELQLNQTAAVDPATAQSVGRLIGAQYLVLGSYQVFQEQIVINARLLRVETGEILETHKVDGRAANALALPGQLAAQFLSARP